MIVNNTHQLNQVKLIEKIENQLRTNSFKCENVPMMSDYKNDPKLCLTSVHFPKKDLLDKILNLIEIIKPLVPEHHYYTKNTLHSTIKNIRINQNPPNFNSKDIVSAQNIFKKVIPRHNSFNVNYFKLVIFPSSLALVGTTDQEFDNIISSLNIELENINIFDDKKYANTSHFFNSITLMRFFNKLSEKEIKAIEQISKKINFKPYLIDTVNVITANASLHKCTYIDKFLLKKSNN